RNLLAYELTCVGDGHVVAKYDGYYRQSVSGYGSQLDDPGKVGHRYFHRISNQTFHFFGREGRRRCDNLHLVVRNIGYCVDGNVFKGVEASPYDAEYQECHNKFIVHGKLYDLLEHSEKMIASRRWNRGAVGGEEKDEGQLGTGGALHRRADSETSRVCSVPMEAPEASRTLIRGSSVITCDAKNRTGT